jgi:hypothetical protein
VPATPPPPAAAPLTRRIRILSSKRRRDVVRFGVRFEAAAVTRGPLRAELRVGSRRIGTLRRTGLARGRVKLRLTLTRSGKAYLNRVLRSRARVRAQLGVRSGGETRRTRFTIYR